MSLSDVGCVRTAFEAGQQASFPNGSLGCLRRSLTIWLDAKWMPEAAEPKGEVVEGVQSIEVHSSVT